MGADIDTTLEERLREEEFSISDDRLGDFTEDAGEASNSRIVMITNDARGFSNNMVMPWHSHDAPALVEVVTWMADMYRRVKEQHASHGFSADPEQVDACNYNALIESEISRIILSLAELIEQESESESMKP